MKRILRKIKEGLKKAVSKRPYQGKTHAKVARIKTSAKSEKKSVAPGKTQALREKLPCEVAVEESKFSTRAREDDQKGFFPSSPQQLVTDYGRDKIVLQVRDPWWLHAYWEVTASTWARLSKEFPAIHSGRFKRLLRVYDVTHINLDQIPAQRYFDIEVTPEANNWYIDVQTPGCSWCVDFGLLLDGNRFITIVRSNRVSTPLDGPSWITDEEWMIPEEMFTRLYGLGVGIGSSPLKLKELWKERLKSEFGSGSGALFSAFSPVKKEKAKDFWLVVNTELIVYGSTEPDAKLTVKGQPVQLRQDGSFSLRFFLPDGKQVIPVVAVSSDGEQARSVTPVVTKETKQK